MNAKVFDDIAVFIDAFSDFVRSKCLNTQIQQILICSSNSGPIVFNLAKKMLLAFPPIDLIHFVQFIISPHFPLWYSISLCIFIFFPSISSLPYSFYPTSSTLFLGSLFFSLAFVVVVDHASNESGSSFYSHMCCVRMFVFVVCYICICMSPFTINRIQFHSLCLVFFFRII